MGRLDGKVAIVTGASRGLGRSISTLFAAEGAAVAVVARTEAQWDPRMPGTIHETVTAIEAAGGRAVAVPADLGDAAQVETVVTRVHEALGPVDILVNNAALTIPGRPPRAGEGPRAEGARPAAPAASTAASPGPSTDLSPGSFLAFPLTGFRQHFEIGTFASYRLMQLVLPDMIERGRGAIVNISSQAGFVPGEGPYERAGSPGPLAYGGNKAALHHLTQTVAQEMQRYGVSVNVLSPSEPVITPGTLVAVQGETDWATPEDFAEATLRVALADPADVTGRLLWSEDVLHPELGRRGWLR
jgi:NAD(P)-dependent dehydrogenase (short-subunit alcohol dehydrogenase family)